MYSSQPCMNELIINCMSLSPQGIIRILHDSFKVRFLLFLIILHCVCTFTYKCYRAFCEFNECQEWIISHQCMYVFTLNDHSISFNFELYFWSRKLSVSRVNDLPIRVRMVYSYLKSFHILNILCLILRMIVSLYWKTIEYWY